MKSVDELVNLYFTSVGRNSKLLLNVPPTRDGLLHATDVERLHGMRARLDAIFAEDRFPDVDAGRPAIVSVADLREDITKGQSVARYALSGFVDGFWRELSRGTTIGYRKLDRFDEVTLTAVRLDMEEAVGEPGHVSIALY